MASLITGLCREWRQPLIHNPVAASGNVVFRWRLNGGSTVMGRDCITDAAAVAWVMRTIADYGGALSKVYVSGHSAGASIASMVGIDERLLAAEGLDFRRLAEFIPCSVQAITQFTIRRERGIPDTRPVTDDFAPRYHVRKDAHPLSPHHRRLTSETSPWKCSKDTRKTHIYARCLTWLTPLFPTSDGRGSC